MHGATSLRPISATALAGWAFLALMGVSMAVFFGLIASTANPILVGIGVALLVGALLFAQPTWNIWLVLLLGLLVVGVLPIWVEGLAGRAVWGVSALAFMLLLRAWWHALSVPHATRGTPAFVWLALAFILYTLFNTLWQPSTAYEALSGFKRYFQVAGLLFALAWLPIGESDVRRWRKLFVLVALVQLPWAVYELVQLVPIREGFRYAYPGLVPIDVVAGTFGANMTSGGANAEMATFLIIVLLFLLARLRQGALPKGRLLWLTPLLLAPLFLGETKVVVVLLPLAFLTLYRRELLARPHVALAGLVVGALLTVAAGYAYLTITKKNLDEQVADTLSYNVYEKGYGGYALNRTTVLSFWAERQGMHDPLGAVFGHGLGSAHDRTGGLIARRYPGYGIGLTAASTLLWEQGIAGTTLFLAMLALAWRAAARVRRQSTEAWAQADAAAIQAALPLFAFYLIYRVALLEVLPFQIVFYALLGYLAWLARRAARQQA
ncbi:MAG: hypothetical protein ACUVSD_09950 [Thiobacillaceae bacterium]